MLNGNRDVYAPKVCSIERVLHMLAKIPYTCNTNFSERLRALVLLNTPLVIYDMFLVRLLRRAQHRKEKSHPTYVVIKMKLINHKYETKVCSFISIPLLYC